MKRIISGLFSSISDAELFIATMGNEDDVEQSASITQAQPSEIATSYDNAQNQGEEQPK